MIIENGIKQVDNYQIKKGVPHIITRIGGYVIIDFNGVEQANRANARFRLKGKPEPFSQTEIAKRQNDAISETNRLKTTEGFRNS